MKKTINFFFYKVFIGKDYADMKQFSLEKWYTHNLPTEYGDANTLGNGDAKYRNIRFPSGIIHADEFETQSGLEWLHLTKHTERGVMKSKVSENALSEIELAEDEYVALDTNVVYNPKNSFLMIQANRNSMSDKTIVEYINLFIPDIEDKIRIVPQKTDIETKLKRNRATKSLTFKYDETSVLFSEPTDDNPKAFSATKGLLGLADAYSVEVILKPKPRSTESLNDQLISELASTVSGNPMVFDKAAIEYEDSETEMREQLDFIGALLKHSQEFEHDAKVAVSKEEIKYAMLTSIRGYEDVVK